MELELAQRENILKSLLPVLELLYLRLIYCRQTATATIDARQYMQCYPTRQYKQCYSTSSLKPLPLKSPRVSFTPN